MIYRHNSNLTLLLLYKNLIYYAKDYNINLKETYLRLSLENKIKDFLKLKKRQFVKSLIISI